MTSRFGAIGLGFALLMLVGSGAAQESKPLDPAVVIGLVQSFYDQTTTLQAEFEQTRYTRLYDRYDRAKGKVVFKKPGMMRWDYAAPNGQVFVSNGKKLLIYQPPEPGEKRGQLIERAVDEDQLPSAFSFLIGSGNLANDFEVRMLEHDNEKFQDGYVLQLIPRRPTPNYEQLVFYVRTLTHGGKRAPPATATDSISPRSSSIGTCPTSASATDRRKGPKGSRPNRRFGRTPSSKSVDRIRERRAVVRGNEECVCVTVQMVRDRACFSRDDRKGTRPGFEEYGREAVQWTVGRPSSGPEGTTMASHARRSASFRSPATQPSKVALT